MSNQVQPGAALVVGRDDVPGRLWRVGRLDHALVGRRVVPPPPDRFDVHRAQLPVLDGVVDPGLEPPPLLAWLISRKYLRRMMPFWTTSSRSTGGTSNRKCSHWSSVQKPITRSTPARLYQERSKRMISPAAGKCAM